MRKTPQGNDLQRMYPSVAAQWHPTRNGDLSPQQVTAYSNQRVWWQCEHGHEWVAAVASRSFRGVRCPFCVGRKVLSGFNDLQTLFPEIAAQWAWELNGELSPDQVRPGSHKKVWWRCASGHEWAAVIYSRTGKIRNGCPICADLRRKKRKIF